MCILNETPATVPPPTLKPPPNRVDRCFESLNGRTALILYLTAGHPTISESAAIAPVVADSADIIEIGIPFSDPVADGPIIQESSQIALRQGTRVEDCLRIAADLRAKSEAAVVFLTYYNPILHYGIDRFATDCANAGVDGVIGADVPPEESAVLRESLAPRDIHLIPLVAPTSTDARLENACSHASGFVYCVSRTGVTGIQEAVATDLPAFLERVRRHTDLPRAVGFGIARPEHAALVGKMAEGVIVGSALVHLIDTEPAGRINAAIREFAASFRKAMDS
jgi:tryptophan synthase alpha chain